MILALALAAAAADVQLSYSARVLDAAGAPVSGARTVEVRLYDGDGVGPSPAWSESYAVDLADGYFSAVLGATAGNPLSDAVLAARPVEVELVVGGVAMARQALGEVPYAAVSASVSPAVLTASLASATCGADGTLGWHAASGTLRVCDRGGWATVWSRTGAGTSASPGWSCLQLLEDGHSTGSGPYWIDPDGAGPTAAFQVHCDMTTDGGGWTLVAYAGTITTNKTTTAGSSLFFPLFDDFGTYDPNAHTTRTPFSRLDRFTHLFHGDSELLAYRTTVPNKKMIWPVSDVQSWRKDALPDIAYLRLTQDGSTWYTRTNKLAVYNQGNHVYTGYDWNSATGGDGTNCDNCGNSFSTGLSHRALLYWEPGDSSYTADQWFHAQPLLLADSTGADNNVQDIAFYLRERPR